MRDIRGSMRQRWLQLFWPDDGRWWPGQVLDVRPKERRISLLYKTGARTALLMQRASCLCTVVEHVLPWQPHDCLCITWLQSWPCRGLWLACWRPHERCWQESQDRLPVHGK